MRTLSKIIIIFILIISCFKGYAQNIPDPMQPYRLVNDFAGIFSAAEQDDLEQILRTYNDTTSTQIFVVTVTDLDGYAVSDYAIRLGEKWQAGVKGKDNGAIVLIKPKIGNERGQVFIATGYGLEEKLNDARVGRIIDNDMLPFFKNNNYYGGTKAAVESMIGYLSGQYHADKEANDEKLSVGDIFLIIIILIIVFIIRRKKKRRKRRFFFGGSSSRSRSSRSFGGGGGGRFGGGGAGRSW